MATGGSYSSECLKQATKIRKCMAKLVDNLPTGKTAFLFLFLSVGLLTQQEQGQIHREQDVIQKTILLLGFIIHLTMRDVQYYDSFLDLLRDDNRHDIAMMIDLTSVTQRDMDITRRSYQTSVQIRISN